MRKSLNRYIPVRSANQMITYLISRGLSDAQIQQLSGREDWKSVSILILDAVDRRIRRPSRASAF